MYNENIKKLDHTKILKNNLYIKLIKMVIIYWGYLFSFSSIRVIGNPQPDRLKSPIDLRSSPFLLLNPFSANSCGSSKVGSAL